MIPPSREPMDKPAMKSASSNPVGVSTEPNSVASARDQTTSAISPAAPELRINSSEARRIAAGASVSEIPDLRRVAAIFCGRQNLVDASDLIEIEIVQHSTHCLLSDDVVVAKAHHGLARDVAQLLLDASDDVFGGPAVVTVDMLDLVEVEAGAQPVRCSQVRDDAARYVFPLGDLLEAFVRGARGLEARFPLLGLDAVVMRQREPADERTQRQTLHHESDQNDAEGNGDHRLASREGSPCGRAIWHGQDHHERVTASQTGPRQHRHCSP